MFLYITLYMWSPWRSVNEFLVCTLGEVFLVWNLRDEAWSSLFWPRASTPAPPLPSPGPPRTRFQGLGHRLVVLSPSAAETWYRESPLSSSFMLPSQVRLFTSFIYCSDSPTLYLQKLQIQELHPQTALLQKTEIRSLAFSEGEKKKKKNTAIKVTK